MEGFAVPFLVVSVLFSLGVRTQVPKDELSERQQQALSIVMEDFHRRDNLQNGFHLATITKAEETVTQGNVHSDFSKGIFVRLEFTLRQTSCKKHQWKESHCAAVRTPRTFNCFACFKFEYTTHKILSDLKDCVLPRYVTAERTEDRMEKCRSVKHKNESGLHLPGSFSFLKSQ